MTRLDRISSLPIWAQNILISLEGLRIQKTRYDKDFRTCLAEAEQRLSWSECEVLVFRDEMLRQIVRHSYETVPYYRRQFDELRLKPEDIRTTEDLHKLPMIDRTVLNENWSAFNSCAVPKSRWELAPSGGTTGQPLVNVLTIEARQRQHATWWRYRQHNGIEFGTSCGLWAQTPVVPPSQKTPPYWRMNYPGRELRLSTSHLNHATYKSYLSELALRRIPWVHGHPSLVGLCASFMNEDGESLPNVRWVTTGAENLLEIQKEQIRKAFNLEPLQHYGNGEGIANFSQCPKGSLHVDEDFSVVEFVECPGNEGQYTVVGTSLWNLARPLLRYDIGDVVQLSDEPCSCGGWGRIVKSIDGRGDDVVVCADGTRVAGFNWVLGYAKNIVAAQIHQSEPGTITLRLVRTKDYSQRDEDDLMQVLRNRIDEHQLRVDVVTVETIERTARGKQRMVISEL